MATNYDKPLTATEIAANLAASSLSKGTQDAIKNALSNGGTVKEIAAVTTANIKGVNVANTAGGTIDLSKASAADIKALEAIIVTGTDKADITIKNNNFNGTVVLGDGDGKVTLATSKAVTVETGKGNDSVTTGSAGDSVVVAAGNDTVNTGAGNDKVVIKDGFVGKATLDGGTGTNTLSLAGVGKVTVDASGALVFGMDKAGSSVTAKNFGAVILGNDGSELALSTSKKALNLTTGTGNDTVSLGSGKDSMVLGGGNDSINAGGGADIVKLAAGFKGNATIDGGAGTDKVDLSSLAIKDAVKVDATHVNVTLANGSVVSIANAESFVYDANGDAAGGIKTVGLTTLDKVVF
jgi:Ca2+-binding RTX toxin-like protein